MIVLNFIMMRFCYEIEYKYDIENYLIKIILIFL
jgi:hypothetical protein